MKARGQSAMEYVTTYGWAVLVVIIIGIVLMQLGFFNFQGKVTPGSSGFSILVPAEWSMLYVGGGNCAFSIAMANAAGEELNSVGVLDGNQCVPATVPSGDISICRIDVPNCGPGGVSFSEDVAITYRRSSDNSSFQSAGTIWGNVGAA